MGLDGGYLTSARSGENVARAVFQTAAHAVGVDRPSGIDARWSRLCYGLQDDVASKPMLQKLSETGFAPPRSAHRWT